MRINLKQGLGPTFKRYVIGDVIEGTEWYAFDVGELYPAYVREMDSDLVVFIPEIPGLIYRVKESTLEQANFIGLDEPDDLLWAADNVTNLSDDFFAVSEFGINADIDVLVREIDSLIGSD